MTFTILAVFAGSSLYLLAGTGYMVLEMQRQIETGSRYVPGLFLAWLLWPIWSLMFLSALISAVAEK